jgi:hypothetical protein
VNTDAAWFRLVERALGGRGMQVIVPFSWGDYENRKQGGYPQYAADEVIQLFRNPTFSYDRIYQGHSAVRLKELMDACHGLGAPVNVIAHSNGTLLTVAALLLGARLDNLLMMGSPLDCDNDRSQTELATALRSVSGQVINFWSPQDEWAMVKGGIGAYGGNGTYTSRNPRIQNIQFRPGTQLRGATIVASGRDVVPQGRGLPPRTVPNFNHSDYMLVQHMPIFTSYIDEFTRSNRAGAGAAVQVEAQQLASLRQLGDWTQVPHYRTRRNVTLESPEMKKYKAQIDRLLR